MARLATAQSATFAQRSSLNVTSVPANSIQKETFTVTGLKTSRPVFVNKPTDDTGLVLVNARVSAANTLELTFWNTTGSAIDPAAQNFDIVQP